MSEREREAAPPVPRRVIPVGYASEWSLSRLANGQRASIWPRKIGPHDQMVFVAYEEPTR